MSDFDVAVIGTGVTGIYALHKFSAAGFSVKGYEAESDVGGTWLRNCYPGARVDVASLDYQYWFSEDLRREWKWSCKYPPQEENLRYLQHVARKFDVYKLISFNTLVESLTFDESTSLWTVRTQQGDSKKYRFVVAALGFLSTPHIPDFPGLSSFAGKVYHTCHWPRDHKVTFAGKRVAVVGVGSSGVQSIPVIAREAEHLVVVQRTPAYCSPGYNVPMTAADHDAFNDNFAKNKEVAYTQSPVAHHDETRTNLSAQFTEEQQQAMLDKAWDVDGGFSPYWTFVDLPYSTKTNALVQEFFRNKIRAIVKDKDTLDKLMPRDEYPIGTKRPVVDYGFYDTFNRDNVTLVDLRRSALKEIVPEGIKTEDGTVYKVDLIVLATGFDFGSGTFLKLNVVGRNGITLKQHWTGGAKTYLGHQTCHFPNLFLAPGPFANPAFCFYRSAEYNIDWICACIKYMQDNKYTLIEPTEDAERKWVKSVKNLASLTLFPKAKSYYNGNNIPGKPQEFALYIRGFPEFVRHIEKLGYNGFRFT